jgi:hypothetical protein
MHRTDVRAASVSQRRDFGGQERVVEGGIMGDQDAAA